MNTENSGRDIIAKGSKVNVQMASRLTGGILRGTGTVINQREHKGFIHYFVKMTGGDWEMGERRWFMESLVFPVEGNRFPEVEHVNP